MGIFSLIFSLGSTFVQAKSGKAAKPIPNLSPEAADLDQERAENEGMGLAAPFFLAIKNQ